MLNEQKQQSLWHFNKDFCLFGFPIMCRVTKLKFWPLGYNKRSSFDNFVHLAGATSFLVMEQNTPWDLYTFSPLNCCRDKKNLNSHMHTVLIC